MRILSRWTSTLNSLLLFWVICSPAWAGMLTENPWVPRSFGREAQRDLLLERIAIDGHRAGGDDILAAVEEERHRLAFHARSLNRQIDFELTAAKGELRRADFGDAHVGESLGLADADGEHRHRQRRAAVQSLFVAVGDTVGENDDARRCRVAVARRGLQQF